MALLFIANATKQPHDFMYRVPAESAEAWRRVQNQRIEAGRQARIHMDAPISVLMAIVDQHKPYGLIHVKDVPTTQAFIGLCYSIDEPIDQARLQYAFDHNQGVMHEDDMRRAEEEAVAIDQALEGNIGTPMNNVEIQVLEDSDAPKNGQALRLVKADPPADVQERRAARRRRAR